MTAQQEIYALLRTFQDGYARRDVSQVDAFMDLFTDDCEVIGTNGIKPGVDEWYTSRAAARALIEGDWEGWGDTTEGIDGEIQTYADKLFAAIQDYATNVAGTPILYDSNAFPYFFEDTNADGERNEGEPGYSAWTPRLLKAAYNFQYAKKDPGAFTHNGKYVIQFLYDSLSSLSQRVTVDMTGMVRPDTPAQ